MRQNKTNWNKKKTKTKLENRRKEEGKGKKKSQPDSPNVSIFLDCAQYMCFLHQAISPLLGMLIFLLCSKETFGLYETKVTSESGLSW